MYFTLQWTEFNFTALFPPLQADPGKRYKSSGNSTKSIIIGDVSTVALFKVATNNNHQNSFQHHITATKHPFNTTKMIFKVCLFFMKSNIIIILLIIIISMTIMIIIILLITWSSSPSSPSLSWWWWWWWWPNAGSLVTRWREAETRSLDSISPVNHLQCIFFTTFYTLHFTFCIALFSSKLH